jgi:hypothetical protein
VGEQNLDRDEAEGWSGTAKTIARFPRSLAQHFWKKQTRKVRASYRNSVGYGTGRAGAFESQAMVAENIRSVNKFSEYYGWITWGSATERRTRL